MRNTRLVLVSLSVYTFDVSNTMFPRQGHCIPRDAQCVRVLLTFIMTQFTLIVTR
jgi:hypothetical protein